MDYRFKKSFLIYVFIIFFQSGYLYSQIKVNESNNVGIGNPAPVVKLDVEGETKISGNVGIGITPTLDKFTVSGLNQNIKFRNESTNTFGLKLNYQNTNNGTSLLYNPAFAQTYLDNTHPITAGTSYGDMHFRQNAAGNMVTRLFIKAIDGNIGIGTTNPTSSLEISSKTGSSEVLQKWSYNPLPSNYFMTIKQDVSSGNVKYVWGQINNGVSYDNVLALNKGTVSIGGTLDSYYKLSVQNSDAEINGIKFGAGGGNVSTNVAIGNYSLNNNTTGHTNVAIGYGSLQSNLVSNQNLGIGYNTLNQYKTGTNNTAIGSQSMALSVRGLNNTVVGASSLRKSNGDSNVGIGTNVGFNIDTCSNNVFIGDYTAAQMTSGFRNVMIGHYAGYPETMASSDKLYIESSTSNAPLIGGNFATNQVGVNTPVSSLANTLHVTGGARISSLATGGIAPTPSGTTRMVVSDANGDLSFGNIPSGTLTSLNGSSNSTQTFSTSSSDLGFNINTNNGVHTFNLPYGETSAGLRLGNLASLVDNAIHIGTNAGGVAGSNIAIGKDALTSTSPGINGQGGTNNVGIGLQSGMSITTGVNNIGIGGFSLANMTTGAYNVAIGESSLLSNIAGVNNVAIGRWSARSVTGSANTGIGSYSLRSNTGSGNTAIGSNAGEFATGSNNTFIGTGSGSSSTASNSVYIGLNAGASINRSGTLAISNGNTSTPLLGGYFDANRIGINTDISSIANTLHVTGGARVTNLSTSGTAPTPSGTTRMVVSDANGDLSFRQIPSNHYGMIDRTSPTTFNTGSSTPVNIPMTNSVFSVGTMNDVSNQFSISPIETGVYDIYFECDFTAGAAGEYIFGFYVDNTLVGSLTHKVILTASQFYPIRFSHIGSVSAGNAIQVRAMTSFTSTNTINRTQLKVKRI